MREAEKEVIAHKRQRKTSRSALPDRITHRGKWLKLKQENGENPGVGNQLFKNSILQKNKLHLRIKLRVQS